MNLNNKRKRIYVNGGIVIMTPFFRHQDVGCQYDIPPENCEIMECDNQIEGKPCIIIEENCAPSIFNEYYAKTFFSTLYSWAPFFHKTYNDCYTEYQNKIAEIVELTTIANISPQMERNILLHVFLGIIAVLDTFVCDTILTKISCNKESFLTYFQKILLVKCSDQEKKGKEEALERIWNDNEMGSTEQEVIDHVLKESYSNVKTIKNIYKRLFGISICDTGGKMTKYFRTRHLIAHRNGRQKSGESYECTRDVIMKLVTDSNDFVKQILNKIT